MGRGRRAGSPRRSGRRARRTGPHGRAAGRGERSLRDLAGDRARPPRAPPRDGRRRPRGRARAAAVPGRSGPGGGGGGAARGGGRCVRLRGAGAGWGAQPRRLLDRSRSVADVVIEGAPSGPLDVDAREFLAGCAARAAVLVAADSLGAMARMLDLAVTYSKQRHQFGVPIGSFQAVKHAAPSILVAVEAAPSAVVFAAASVDAGGPQSALHAAAVKAQVTAAGARVADSALTLHGAIGYTWEHDLHLFYKRAKLDEHLC